MLLLTVTLIRAYAGHFKYIMPFYFLFIFYLQFYSYSEITSMSLKIIWLLKITVDFKPLVTL